MEPSIEDEVTEALRLEAQMAERGARRVFYIDGVKHFVPGADVCNCIHRRNWHQYRYQCPECGGYRHFQGVYYGAVYAGEDCGNSD